MPPVRANAMDHVVLVLFENRSFDNLLGRLYVPGEVEKFEGVIGKDLSNPVPDWAEHGAEGGAVPYGISPGMDVPDPDPGEEYPHTNTQLFNVLDDVNRCKDATEMVAPYNAPPDGRPPTMDGFVTDYISFLTVELGRQPTYEEYSQIMTGYTPEQVPVISALARGFGVFDHWFSEVPSQTLPNRSFWTAATSSGFVVNRPVTNFMRHHMAETIFDRLERNGRSWKIYVLEPGPLSFTGFIHMPRLRDRFATHFFPFADFERDAAEGTLPDFSLIEPNLLAGHGDYHPAFGRALIPGVDILMDAPSSILAGEDFLSRIYRAVRSAAAPAGSNAFNTVLFVGFDEPGGTYDHVPPGPVPPPSPGSPPGQLGFKFDRSGYRVPAVIVSPWVPQGTVCTDEYRHTSLIATLREAWNLGEPFTARDAAAPSFAKLLNLEAPRSPETWPDVDPLPVPVFQAEQVEAMRALGTLGRHLCHGLYEHARHDKDLPDPPESDPKVSPALALDFALHLGSRLFPKLARPLPGP
ncbi:MAG TPA: alkaline phosphatase family protein [Acidimicrobiales bacterium]|nr:alkaline phosphatase family protein [Acidimicrobiales bacterium]